MYILKSEHSFDSAHFLSGYEGKCANIHGHRWKVEVEVQSETLTKGGQLEGMVIDFGDLKRDVKSMADSYDHALIVQIGSMRDETLNCINQDGFKVILVDFRTTAENFAKFFFKKMKDKGYNVKRTTVYETPNNSASYEESEAH
ncbi:6-carboxytetrahydropterin synthase QueD [Clostridium estertheticum]|uniref:6-carboxy-5,6,7,8-tetrahydropterin synthase n=2 Tax=Clostridium estertheticum TaxID=238834 RepID=A0A1J0GDZ2_9CLOT|nr:6-carboxytetrahydropterin synthase QueD [Clostridium estertheticum]APC39572.1 6-carboxytetrahydropterin synthase QueD [Clostridium estertheticum subsp. estertheticum]MBU3072254.1 6-carboxytetrahydropterin synthase QueD [Clostridium estertheticum]MBU3162346.1 6-carboxytetrahydropterin synthase QueD [Clostridium estertheticum]MBU3170777.1 6-carboxytetrahydropterin synthase QueD [Clostridium estertheticum]MBU3184592.1 6-carboxytetrahydropterin synthase QueD [Clostridium estertheticum]